MSRPQKEGLDYYYSALKVDIETDLNKNPELKCRIGWFCNKFIKWCCDQRIVYEADIHDEVNEFFDLYIAPRLYNINIDLWKEISHLVFKRDNYTCHYCGQVGGILEIDHLTPISRGGTNDLNNLKASCRKCNRQKKDKTEQEYLTWRNSK